MAPSVCAELLVGLDEHRFPPRRIERLHRGNALDDRIGLGEIAAHAKAKARSIGGIAGLVQVRDGFFVA